MRERKEEGRQRRQSEERRESEEYQYGEGGEKTIKKGLLHHLSEL